MRPPSLTCCCRAGWAGGRHPRRGQAQRQVSARARWQRPGGRPSERTRGQPAYLPACRPPPPPPPPPLLLQADRAVPVLPRGWRGAGVRGARGGHGACAARAHRRRARWPLLSCLCHQRAGGEGGARVCARVGVCVWGGVCRRFVGAAPLACQRCRLCGRADAPCTTAPPRPPRVRARPPQVSLCERLRSEHMAAVVLDLDNTLLDAVACAVDPEDWYAH